MTEHSESLCNDSERGLYAKYDVRDAVTGAPVVYCFVLRPDRDPAAKAALRAYADATDNEALAEGIRRSFLPFDSDDFDSHDEVMEVYEDMDAADGPGL